MRTVITSIMRQKETTLNTVVIDTVYSAQNEMKKNLMVPQVISLIIFFPHSKV